MYDVYNNNKKIGVNTVSMVRPTILRKPAKIAAKLTLRERIEQRAQTHFTPGLTQYKRHFKIRGIAILCILGNGQHYVPRSQIFALLGQDSSNCSEELKNLTCKTAAELGAVSPNVDHKTLFIGFNAAMNLLLADIKEMPSTKESARVITIKKIIYRHKGIYRLSKYAATLPAVDIALPKEIYDLSTIKLNPPKKHVVVRSENTHTSSESDSESLNSSSESVNSQISQSSKSSKRANEKPAPNKRRRVIVDDSSDDESIVISNDDDVRESDDRIAVERKRSALTTPFNSLMSENGTSHMSENGTSHMSENGTSHMSENGTSHMSENGTSLMSENVECDESQGITPINTAQMPNDRERLAAETVAELSTVLTTNAPVAPMIVKNIIKLTGFNTSKMGMLELLVSKQETYIKLQNALLLLNEEIVKIRNDITNGVK
ncbi:hypothetical protein D6_00275 [Faustovirus]|nr:hypothetical protein D6_00275 [Faustovirus]